MDYVPQNSHMGVPAPRTSECGLSGDGHSGCNWGDVLLPHRVPIVDLDRVGLATARTSCKQLCVYTFLGTCPSTCRKHMPHLGHELLASGPRDKSMSRGNPRFQSHSQILMTPDLPQRMPCGLHTASLTHSGTHSRNKVPGGFSGKLSNLVHCVHKLN